MEKTTGVTVYCLSTVILGSGGHVRTADVLNEEKLRHIVAMDLFFFLKYLRLPFICFVNGSVIKASNSFNRE